ncbi:MAG: photosystem I reaction center subunit XI [Thermosynechococcaceae cyanobacterium]
MTQGLIQHAGDPQVGELATPINASGFSKAFINNLPAYRPGLSMQRRGLEIGMAHGYFLYGIFASAGPQRATEHAGITGLIATLAIVTLLTIGLSLHGAVRTGAAGTNATVANPPAEFGTKEGWSEFASGFLLGGCGGSFFAYLLLQIVPITIWSVV